MDSFAILLQFFMAVAALSSLFYKRRRESPQRPFIVWFFDASKQAGGAGYVHFLNIIVSFAFGQGSSTATNPCVWYFLNVLVDTTVGVYILVFFLNVQARIIKVTHIRDMDQGYYGTPPQLLVWSKQFVGFLTCLTLTKLTVIVILQWQALTIFASWLISPIKDPKWQVVVVMVLFPFVMNIIQFWLIDNHIKGTLLTPPANLESDLLTAPTPDVEDEEISRRSNDPLVAADSTKGYHITRQKYSEDYSDEEDGVQVRVVPGTT